MSTLGRGFTFASFQAAGQVCVDSERFQRVLAKLRAYGFSDAAIGLLRSYFSERANSVRIGTKTTIEWKEMFRGCPQGSNFGPLLWNVFQNDLVYNTHKSSIKMKRGAGMAQWSPTQASHQCGPGSIPGLGVICESSLLLVLFFAPRGFSPVLRFSPLLKNQHF